MNDFLAQHGPMALTVLWFLFMGVAAVAGKLFWDKLGRMEKRQDEMESDLQSIKGNYLNRFESIHSSLAQTRDQILQKIHELHIFVVESAKPKIKRR